MQENNGSVTVLIEKQLVNEWGEALTKLYGEATPHKNGDLGHSWVLENYEYLEKSKKITIHKWDNPSDRKPKLLIQAGQDFAQIFATQQLGESVIIGTGHILL